MKSRIYATLFVVLFASTLSFAGWDEGVAAFTSSNYELAVKEFKAHIAVEPTAWRGHYMLGLSLRMVDNKSESLHHLRKAYDLNPNELSVKIAFVKANMLMSNFNQSEQLASSLVKSHPNNYKAHKLLGSILLNQNKPREALNHLRKAYDLNPNDLSLKFYIESIDSKRK